MEIAFETLNKHVMNLTQGLKMLIFRIRIPWPLQWGSPTFEADHTFGILAGALATLIEVTI